MRVTDLGQTHPERLARLINQTGHRARTAVAG